ncbi:MAG: hypothetical protein MUD00_00680 [Candidatus Pacebacteria bacterium]|jgi:hypothetical protein|nr:hypothetical protein [Candidatus Paceibacterota bacterium]
MIDFTEQQMEEKFNAVPRSVRALIFDPIVGEKTQSIGKKYGLLLDASSDLLAIVQFALFGFITQEDIKKEIIEALKVSNTVASAITVDIKNEIVAPIFEKMRKQQEETTTEKITDEEIALLLTEPEDDSSGFAQAGIEIQSEKPFIGDEEKEAFEEHKVLLKQIERTTSPIQTSNEIQRGITGEKFSGNFKIPHEERDYSINKQSDADTVSLKVIRHRDRVDPYREPLE